jgi:molybdate transport system ATP-binding protein
VAARDTDYALAYLDFPGGRLSVPDSGLAPGARVRVRIAARDVSLSLGAPSATSILNVFPAQVTAISEDRPAQALVALTANGVPLLARITRKSVHLLGLAPGSAVFAQVKSVALPR